MKKIIEVCDKCHMNVTTKAIETLGMMYFPKGFLGDETLYARTISIQSLCEECQDKYESIQEEYSKKIALEWEQYNP